MAKGPVTRSDLLEQKYEHGLTLVIRGVTAIVIGLIAVWIGNLLSRGQSQGGIALFVLGAFVAVGGGLAAVYGAFEMGKGRAQEHILEECPYCEFAMEFLVHPTEDYTCEKCKRRVYYEDGKRVPVREIACTVCGTMHKVAVTVDSFTCDRCNRTLSLGGKEAPAAVTVQKEVVAGNQDVYITAIGRRPNEVALALQDLLVCNLPEARRQMESLPVLVATNVPPMKAEAIKRRLAGLGAESEAKPTSVLPGPV